MSTDPQPTPAQHPAAHLPARVAQLADELSAEAQALRTEHADLITVDSYGELWADAGLQVQCQMLENFAGQLRELLSEGPTVIHHTLSATNAPTEETVTPLHTVTTFMPTGIEIRFTGTHQPNRGSVFVELSGDGCSPSVVVQDSTGTLGGADGDPIIHQTLRLEDDLPE